MKCPLVLVVILAALWPAQAMAAPPGSLDRSFGSNGTAFGIGHAARARSVALGPDGSVIAGGSAQDPSGHLAFAVTRFTANGQPDPAFGSAGSVLVQLGQGQKPQSQISALVPEPDGSVVAVGDATDSNGAPAFAAARFDRTGRMVWSAVHQVSPGPALLASWGYHAVRQPDGNVVVAGTAASAGDYALALARLNGMDGSLDPSFGGRGYITPTHPSRGLSMSVASLLRSATGQIIVAGGGSYCGFVKGDCHPVTLFEAYTPSGVRDTTFAPPPVGLNDFAGLAPTPRGELMALGHRGNVITLARFTASGTLDTTFAPPTGYRPAPLEGPPGSIIVQPDGRIIAPVFSGTSNPQGRLVRFLADGSRDLAFANGGTVLVPLTAERSAIALQPDGRIIVAGYLGAPGIVAGYQGAPGSEYERFTVVRLLGGTAYRRVAIGTTARVTQRWARLRLTCGGPHGALCAGRLTIQPARSAPDTGRHGRRAAAASYGRASYSLAAGNRTTVAIRLNQAAMGKLRRGSGQLTVRVIAAHQGAPATMRRVKLRA